ncbi:MAG: hypothetical protein QF405_17150, partial [Roseibacillus sp.]|nr:hypothetical protein [Roseibacillus sp.]
AADVTIETTGGFSLLLAGTVRIAELFEITGMVQFRLELAGDDPGIELIVNGKLALPSLGMLTLTNSGFRINSEGLVASFNVALDVSFGGEIGLKFNVSAIFELNTTSSDQTLGTGDPIQPGFRFRLDGSVEFLGFATASGFVEIAMGTFGFEMDFDIRFNLGPLSFSATGGAGVYLDDTATGVDEGGIALALQIRATAEAAIFSLDASGTLEVNTTDVEHTLGTLNVAANSFTLALSGKVELIKVLKLDASFRIEVREQNGETYWSIQVGVSLDFFSIAKVSGSFFVDSEGEFDVQVSGYVSLGGGGTGLFGDFHFHVTSGKLKDASGNVVTDGLGNPQYIFSLGLSASVRAKLFGITLASFGINASFTAQGNGTTPIVLSVTVRIKILFFTIKKTASFKIGTLQLPEAVYLAGGQTTPQAWNVNPNAGGTLYLNVGDRAHSRNLARGDPDESYIIDDLGASAEGVGRRIRVTAFGRSNMIENVTQIVGDFGDGSDSVVFTGATPIPVTLNMGVGEDIVVWDGSGHAEITGGDETGSNDEESYGDYIEIRGSGTATVDAGNGDDYVVHTVEAGATAGAVTMNGDEGRDRLLGGTGNDIINGHGGEDEIDGPALRVDGGADNDLINFYVALQSSGGALDAGSGSDVVNIIGTPAGDAITISNSNATTLGIDINGATISAAHVETLLIDGRGGGDSFVIDDLSRVNDLSSFNINFGQTVTQIGIITRTMPVGDTTITIEEPNLVASPDRSADQLTVLGGAEEDLFFVNAAGPDPDAGIFQSISVVRGGQYSVNIVNSVRSESDSLTVNGQGGNDTIDASGVGVSSTIPATESQAAITIEPVDRVILNLIGGTGNDTLLGSPFDDSLDGGTG